MSEQYALLIGVDFYFPDPLPDGIYYPSLGGCVRDISHVQTYLCDTLNLAPDHVLMLTSTNTGGGQPAEPADQWPTYANMVAKLRQLTAIAAPGDQVYIHYSGHGGRASTIFPQVKGDGSADETLVPLDVGRPEGRYLRDLELAYLLKTMVDKGLILTVVLDSCHSGGATRGPGKAVKRGISRVDNRALPQESLVAPLDQLAGAWQQAGGVGRGVKPASGWLLEPKGYVLFSACRAAESAYEFPFDGNESNGALTYWLLDSLRHAGPGYSCKMVYDRILAKVHSQFEQQTPQLQGRTDRAFFAADLIRPYFAVTVLEADANRVRLNAGEAHGLRAGADFALYPNRPGVDLNKEADRLALAAVTQVEAASAWANITQDLGRGPVEQGSQAVLLNRDDLRLQRGVAVVIQDLLLKQQVEAAIAQEGKGFVAVAAPNERIDFSVVVNPQGEFAVWDPAGAEIAGMNPPLRADDPAALPKLVTRLIHLAKYRNVQELNVPDPATRRKLKLELLGAPAGASPGDPAISHPGDQIILRITNTQTPGAENDPARILNVCILGLDSDWSITQIYPANAAFEPVDPGQSIEPTLEAYLPDGQAASTTLFKVFATQATTDFRWLQLPALDQADQPRSTQRAAITDPLEMLLAAVTAGVATTRAVKLVSSPQQDRGWTVEEAMLRVEAQPAPGAQG